MAGESPRPEDYRAELEAERGRLVDGCLIFGAVAGTIALAASLSRLPRLGWNPVLVAHLFGYVAIVVAAIARKRISLTIRTAVMLGIMGYFSVTVLHVFGLVGAAPVVLLSMAVLASAIFGTRAGVVTASAGLAMLVGYAAVHLSGVLEPRIDVAAHATSPSTWAAVVTAFALFAFVVVRATGALQDRLLTSFLGLAERSAELSESRTGLEHETKERLAAARKLKESEKLYRTLVETMNEGLGVHDVDGSVTYVNEWLCQILGYSREEMIGQPTTRFIAPASVSDFRLAQEKAARDELATFEALLIPKAGDAIAVLVSPVTLRDDEGERTGGLAVITDLSAVKRVEEERRQLEEKLRQAEKLEAIGQLAGGIAHDFNNQLTGIVGCADLLCYKVKDSDEARELAEMVRSAASHSAGLTRQLLAFARKGKYRSIPVDVKAVVSDVAALLERSIDRRVVISTTADAGGAAILGDPTQVQNALLNLGLNARDAMPDGGELDFATDVVQLSGEENPCGLPPGRYVRVRVSDTGHGMDVATQRRIFEPFFTTKESGKGTGMGLASVLGTVESHGGGIEVDSAKGIGTTFALYLPATDRVATPASTRPAEPRGSRAAILVVDDNPGVRKTVSIMLDELGYDVAEAADGPAAIELVEARGDELDLVILDLNMPLMSGKETFFELRKRAPQLKVLLASGFSVEEEASELLAQGASGLLQKPYGMADLAERLQLLLAPSSVADDPLSRSADAEPPRS